MAEPLSKEEYKWKKKGYDQTRPLTCVNIGKALQCWRDVREWEGLKTEMTSAEN